MPTPALWYCPQRPMAVPDCELATHIHTVTSYCTVDRPQPAVLLLPNAKIAVKAEFSTPLFVFLSFSGLGDYLWVQGDYLWVQGLLHFHELSVPPARVLRCMVDAYCGGIPILVKPFMTQTSYVRRSHACCGGIPISVKPFMTQTSYVRRSHSCLLWWRTNLGETLHDPDVIRASVSCLLWWRTNLGETLHDPDVIRASVSCLLWWRTNLGETLHDPDVICCIPQGLPFIVMHPLARRFTSTSPLFSINSKLSLVRSTSHTSSCAPIYLVDVWSRVAALYCLLHFDTPMPSSLNFELVSLLFSQMSLMSRILTVSPLPHVYPSPGVHSLHLGVESRAADLTSASGAVVHPNPTLRLHSPVFLLLDYLASIKNDYPIRDRSSYMFTHFYPSISNIPPTLQFMWVRHKKCLLCRWLTLGTPISTSSLLADREDSELCLLTFNFELKSTLLRLELSKHDWVLVPRSLPFITACGRVQTTTGDSDALAVAGTRWRRVQTTTGDSDTLASDGARWDEGNRAGNGRDIGRVRGEVGKGWGKIFDPVAATTASGSLLSFPPSGMARTKTTGRTDQTPAEKKAIMEAERAKKRQAAAGQAAKHLPGKGFVPNDARTQAPNKSTFPAKPAKKRKAVLTAKQATGAPAPRVDLGLPQAGTPPTSSLPGAVSATALVPSYIVTAPPNTLVLDGPGFSWDNLGNSLPFNMISLQNIMNGGIELHDEYRNIHDGSNISSTFTVLETGSSMPPWSAMATPDGARKLIQSKFLPNGVGLKDPSRMVKTEVEAIYKLWMQRQTEKKIALHFKVAEAKRKNEEDQRKRAESLKRKQPRYMGTSDGDDEEEDDPKAAKGTKRQRKQGTGEQPSHEESAGGGGRKKSTSSSTKKSKAATKPKGNTVAALPAKAKQQAEVPDDQGSSGPRPRPRPIIRPELRQSRLLHVSRFGPYTSLVLDVLRLSVGGTTQNNKTTLPTWCNWTNDIVIGDHFFDLQNKKGFLPNWQAVLAWMHGNPHISDDGSPLSHAQASDILLIVGITHYVTKTVAEAEPGSPFHDLPFELSDLDKVEAGIKSMLAHTKKLFKFGVALHGAVDTNWKRVCLEVGLAETDIKVFGNNWRAFMEVYATLDSVLVRSGKAPQAHASNFYPEALQNWSRTSEADGNLVLSDNTDWADAMGSITQVIVDSIKSAQDANNLDRVLEEEWSRRGKGGLVCVVLGMKWWRLRLDSSTDEDSLAAWQARVDELAAGLKTLTTAQSMYGTQFLGSSNADMMDTEGARNLVGSTHSMYGTQFLGSSNADMMDTEGARNLVGSTYLSEIPGDICRLMRIVVMFQSAEPTHVGIHNIPVLGRPLRASLVQYYSSRSADVGLGGVSNIIPYHSLWSAEPTHVGIHNIILHGFQSAEPTHVGMHNIILHGFQSAEPTHVGIHNIILHGQPIRLNRPTWAFIILFFTVSRCFQSAEPTHVGMHNIILHGFQSAEPTHVGIHNIILHGFQSAEPTHIGLHDIPVLGRLLRASELPWSK
ncbi:hypothetical protein C8R46DRAFT_1042164 [Mycena filopes]|nr:hypothetical protein C8R46DRAFT_1042164 [Mycena filopes]